MSRVEATQYYFYTIIQLEMEMRRHNCDNYDIKKNGERCTRVTMAG
jgi:hypothetical protein